MALDIKTGRSLYVKLKWAASIVTSISILFGAFAWAGDARWAKIEAMRAWDSRVLSVVRQAVDNLRKQQLEDKIYEIVAVPEKKRTDTQRAVLDRSIRQLNELATSQER